MREIREIKVKEIRNENKKEEGYKQIKPETNITVDEALEFWKQEFAKHNI